MDKAVQRAQFPFYYIWSPFKKRLIFLKPWYMALTMLFKKWFESKSLILKKQRRVTLKWGIILQNVLCDCSVLS